MISAVVKLRSRGGGTKVVVLSAWVGGGGGILFDIMLLVVWTVVEVFWSSTGKIPLIADASSGAGFISPRAHGSNVLSHHYLIAKHGIEAWKDPLASVYPSAGR